MNAAEEILRTCTTYALFGASQDVLKYSYELFHTLLEAGYTVYPVNPRYQRIDAHVCYPSLSALPAVPEVAITALAPANTEKVLEDIAARGVHTVWMPPGSSSQAALAKCRELGLKAVHDVCPVAMLRRMKPQR
jgi:predicted CoA-binding protein